MTEHEDAVLKAEVVALQAVLISVFRRIASDKPEFAPIFCRAFDEAETILAGVAEKLGIDAPIETTVGALTVIEELRSAVIRDPGICLKTDGSQVRSRSPHAGMGRIRP